MDFFLGGDDFTYFLGGFNYYYYLLIALLIAIDLLNTVDGLT